MKMEKELCFIIEEDKLFLEKVLVDYLDVPIFFLCKSKKSYYIVLCIDMEELDYIVERLSVGEVYKLFHGEIAMRDVFLLHERFWKVSSGENVTLDRVERCTKEQLDVNVLPESGAEFRILTSDMEKYVKSFDSMFFQQGYSNSFTTMVEEIKENCDGILGCRIEEFLDMSDLSYDIEIKPTVSERIYDKGFCSREPNSATYVNCSNNGMWESSEWLGTAA